MINNNKDVVDTNISINSLSNLRNTSGLINKIACFDSNGSLNVINVNLI